MIFLTQESVEDHEEEIFMNEVELKDLLVVAATPRSPKASPYTIIGDDVWFVYN